MTTHREVWDHYDKLTIPLEAEYRAALKPILDLRKTEIDALEAKIGKINKRRLEIYQRFDREMHPIAAPIIAKIDALHAERDARLRELDEREREPTS